MAEIAARDVYNRAYQGSKPIPVQLLREMINADRRLAVAMQLVVEGLGPAIDQAVDVEGRDPYDTALERWEIGYVWVPSIVGDPVVVTPGAHVPGLPDYDPEHPPAHSIPVVTDPALLVPINPPRNVGYSGYRAVVQFLIEHGIYPQNGTDAQGGELCVVPAGHDAIDCSPDELVRSNVLAATYPWSQRHFGVVIDGKVIDAEWLSLQIPRGIDAVKKYIAEAK